MKGKNPIVIILVALLVLGGLLSLILSGDDEPVVKTVGKGGDKVQKSVGETVAEPVDGDRLPQEFTKLMVDMRDMQATMQEMNENMSQIENENTQLKQQAQEASQKADDAQLKVQEGNDLLANLDRPENKIFVIPQGSDSKGQTPNQGLNQLGEFIAPIEGAKNKVESMVSGKPVKPLAAGTPQSVVTDQIVWIPPMDAGYATDKKGGFNAVKRSINPTPGGLTDFDQEKPGLFDEIGSKTMRKAGLEAGVEPRFTIPNGSVITDSLAVTALVGRIPVNGRVIDPWRFKISTGRNIVMPNDHELQGLEKTIVQGDAIGDLNLRCVTGKIDTITFVFNDGRIVTHQSKQVGNSGSGQSKPGQYLGYISDEYANPCISGDLITNAPAALTQLGLLSAGEGFARGVAEAEVQTNTTSEGGVVRNVVGDQMKFAGYNGVADGMSSVRGWFEQRMGQFFDVIYAQAGKTVDIHIEQEIKIDYDPMGRKVRYATTQNDATGYMD